MVKSKNFLSLRSNDFQIQIQKKKNVQINFLTVDFRIISI